MGTFPVASVIERKFRRHGMDIIRTSQDGSHWWDLARFNLREMVWIHSRGRS